MIGDNARSRRRRGRKSAEPYRLSEFLGAYLLGLGIWILSLGTSVKLHVPLAFIVHLLVGLFLSRFVSRRVIWNWHIASIAQIARAKWATFIAWQLAVPVLIWQLMIYKYL